MPINLWYTTHAKGRFMTMKIALIDDHPIVLAGLVDLIGKMGGYDVVGTGQCAEDALCVVNRHDIDLLVMDLNMPGPVQAVISEIAAQTNAPKILVFTASNKVDDCLASIESGANGYVVKGSSGGELFHAMTSVLKGEDYVTGSLASRVMREMRNREQKDQAVALSHREEQVITHLLRGASNRDIALQLKLSEHTVKYYMTQIMQKFDVQNRVEVVLAIQNQRRFDA